MKALPQGVLSVLFQGLGSFFEKDVLYPCRLNGFAPALFAANSVPFMKYPG
jgi:hypothetical protein